MIRWTAAMVTVVSLLALAAGCSQEETSGGGKLVVTTTVGMLADTVERVGGERVEVTALMGPGVDPHLYKASARDLDRLRRADLIIYIGLHLEGKMVDVLSRLSAGGSKAVAVGEAIGSELLLTPSGFKGQHDPHIWFDVSLWAKTIGPVAKALAEIDPDGREYYEENAAAYRDELLAFHEEIKKKLAEIPRRRRVLVTAHDAFGYFGRAYDIEVVGLQGISTAGEFGVSDRKRIVDLIISRGIRAVFIESSVSPQAVRAVVADCEQLGHKVDGSGELFSDAMGEASTPEGTYIGMVRHNVDTIVKALK